MADMHSIIAGAAYVKFSLDNAELKKGLDESQGSIRKFMSDLTSQAGKIQLIATIASKPFSVLLGKFADFDYKMRQVGAITNSTASEMRSLTNSARELGRTTSFTTSEIAESMTMLARMGFTTRQIEKSIKPIMNVAMATGESMATASEVAGAVMRIFSIDAADLTSVVDVLTATVNGSAQGLQDLFEGMSKAGPVFARSNSNVIELAGSLGVLANMGIKGSMAGTALKRMYSRFSEGDITQILFSKGVNVTDYTGKFRPFYNILLDTAKVMNKMSQIERLSFAQEIFETRGMLAGLPLTMNIDRMEEFIGMLEDSSGIAERQANKMEDGIRGAVKHLVSAAEDLNIQIGEIFVVTLKPIIEQITKAFNDIRGLIGPIYSFMLPFIEIAHYSTVFAVGIFTAAKSFGIIRTVLGPMKMLNDGILNIVRNNDKLIRQQKLIDLQKTMKSSEAVYSLKDKEYKNALARQAEAEKISLSSRAIYDKTEKEINDAKARIQSNRAKIEAANSEIAVRRGNSSIENSTYSIQRNELALQGKAFEENLAGNRKQLKLAEDQMKKVDSRIASINTKINSAITNLEKSKNELDKRTGSYFRYNHEKGRLNAVNNDLQAMNEKSALIKRQVEDFGAERKSILNLIRNSTTDSDTNIYKARKDAIDAKILPLKQEYSTLQRTIKDNGILAKEIKSRMSAEMRPSYSKGDDVDFHAQTIARLRSQENELLNQKKALSNDIINKSKATEASTRAMALHNISVLDNESKRRAYISSSNEFIKAREAETSVLRSQNDVINSQVKSLESRAVAEKRAWKDADKNTRAASIQTKSAEKELDSVKSQYEEQRKAYNDMVMAQNRFTSSESEASRKEVSNARNELKKANSIRKEALDRKAMFEASGVRSQSIIEQKQREIAALEKLDRRDLARRRTLISAIGKLDKRYYSAKEKYEAADKIYQDRKFEKDFALLQAQDVVDRRKAGLLTTKKFHKELELANYNVGLMKREEADALRVRDAYKEQIKAIESKTKATEQLLSKTESDMAKRTGLTSFSSQQYQSALKQKADSGTLIANNNKRIAETERAMTVAETNYGNAVMKSYNAYASTISPVAKRTVALTRLSKTFPELILNSARFSRQMSGMSFGMIRSALEMNHLRKTGQELTNWLSIKFDIFAGMSKGISMLVNGIGNVFNFIKANAITVSILLISAIRGMYNSYINEMKEKADAIIDSAKETLSQVEKEQSSDRSKNKKVLEMLNYLSLLEQSGRIEEDQFKKASKYLKIISNEYGEIAKKIMLTTSGLTGATEAHKKFIDQFFGNENEKNAVDKKIEASGEVILKGMKGIFLHWKSETGIFDNADRHGVKKEFSTLMGMLGLEDRLVTRTQPASEEEKKNIIDSVTHPMSNEKANVTIQYELVIDKIRDVIESRDLGKLLDFKKNIKEALDLAIRNEDTKSQDRLKSLLADVSSYEKLLLQRRSLNNGTDDSRKDDSKVKIPTKKDAISIIQSLEKDLKKASNRTGNDYRKNIESIEDEFNESMNRAEEARKFSNNAFEIAENDLKDAKKSNDAENIKIAQDRFNEAKGYKDRVEKIIRGLTLKKNLDLAEAEIKEKKIGRTQDKEEDKLRGNEKYKVIKDEVDRIVKESNESNSPRSGLKKLNEIQERFDKKFRIAINDYLRKRDEYNRDRNNPYSLDDYNQSLSSAKEIVSVRDVIMDAIRSMNDMIAQQEGFTDSQKTAVKMLRQINSNEIGNYSTKKRNDVRSSLEQKKLESEIDKKAEDDIDEAIAYVNRLLFVQNGIVDDFQKKYEDAYASSQREGLSRQEQSLEGIRVSEAKTSLDNALARESFLVEKLYEIETGRDMVRESSADNTIGSYSSESLSRALGEDSYQMRIATATEQSRTELISMHGIMTRMATRNQDNREYGIPLR